jgi:hypothetical protein
MEKETMLEVNVTQLNAHRSKEKLKVGTAFETQSSLFFPLWLLRTQGCTWKIRIQAGSLSTH